MCWHRVNHLNSADSITLMMEFYYYLINIRILVDKVFSKQSYLIMKWPLKTAEYSFLFYERKLNLGNFKCLNQVQKGRSCPQILWLISPLILTVTLLPSERCKAIPLQIIESNLGFSKYSCFPDMRSPQDCLIFQIIQLFMIVRT